MRLLIIFIGLFAIIAGVSFFDDAIEEFNTNNYKGVTELPRAQALEIIADYQDKGSFTMVDGTDPVTLICNFSTTDDISELSNITKEQSTISAWLLVVIGIIFDIIGIVTIVLIVKQLITREEK